MDFGTAVASASFLQDHIVGSVKVIPEGGVVPLLGYCTERKNGRLGIALAEGVSFVWRTCRVCVWRTCRVRSDRSGDYCARASGKQLTVIFVLCVAEKKPVVICNATVQLKLDEGPWTVVVDGASPRSCDRSEILSLLGKGEPFCLPNHIFPTLPLGAYRAYDQMPGQKSSLGTSTRPLAALLFHSRRERLRRSSC